MSVAELIARLSELPPELPVKVVAAEPGTFYLTTVDIYNWPDGTRQVEVA